MRILVMKKEIPACAGMTVISLFLVFSLGRIKPRFMERGGYVYIMSNKYRTVYYIGVTSNLINRVEEHKSLNSPGFTSKYKCIDLVYFECFTRIEEAIAKEKQMKKWKRAWKENVIRKLNPEMLDLSGTIEDYN